jgi:flavin-dependent dehydrogenase
LKGTDRGACAIESLDSGWLFLVADSLIAVGGTPEALLGSSRLVAPQVAEIEKSGSYFPCYPRISVPLSGPGWLACGTAAMSFDPICGEGAGHAVREAILASAVLGRIHSETDPEAALIEYNARMLAGFMRHLQLCRQFYVSGRQSEWWDIEIEALDRGIEWTRQQLEGLPRPSARLVGFDLIAPETS